MRLALTCIWVGNVYLMLALTIFVQDWDKVFAFCFGLGWIIAGVSMLVTPKPLTQAEVDRIAEEAK